MRWRHYLNTDNLYCGAYGEKATMTSRHPTYSWRHQETGNKAVSICWKFWVVQGCGPRVSSSAQMRTEVLKKAECEKSARIMKFCLAQERDQIHVKL